MELAWPVLLVVVVLAGALLFTPYEAVLEGVIAFVMITTVVAGFLMHPRREVFYVRTAIPLIDPDRNKFLEHDLLAVRVELVRLWLLFVPTVLAVASLVFFAAGGPMQFSFLNWLFSSRYAPIAILVLQYPPLFVLLLTAAWIGERRVMRDAEACSARSFSISHAQVGRAGRISYLFMGEHGEYYGGDCFCLYLGLVQPHELATIVFHNVRKPELNKIAMGFLFHRLIILGRGVTELDKQTAEVQTVLTETTSFRVSTPDCRITREVNVPRLPGRVAGNASNPWKCCHRRLVVDASRSVHEKINGLRPLLTEEWRRRIPRTAGQSNPDQPNGLTPAPRRRRGIRNTSGRQS